VAQKINTTKIDTMMVFAAGLGTRMQDLTRNTAKPLVYVAGRPVLYHVLDFACTSGCEKIVINVHYFADQMIDAINKYTFPKNIFVVIEHEDVRLETGGGLRNAFLKHFPDEKAIFTINADNIVQYTINPFDRLRSYWDESTMDLLMLTQNIQDVVGEVGRADFTMLDRNDIFGRLYQPDTRRDLLFTGVQIVKPSLLDSYQVEPFSITRVYKESFRNEKVYGVQNHGGRFLHISRPHDLEQINEILHGI
jgi:MurNAc alpha-1-phosphate uridylyltransferase